MELFSLWTKAVFINLAFALYSESALIKYPTHKMKIDCAPYANYINECTKEYYPICATNGKTYCNKCVFCTSLSSLWTQIIFILALVIPFYHENTFAFPTEVGQKPNCDVYKSSPFMCTRERDPICATNGHTYSNECIFCSTMISLQIADSFQFDVNTPLSQGLVHNQPTVLLGRHPIRMCLEELSNTWKTLLDDESSSSRWLVFLPLGASELSDCKFLRQPLSDALEHLETISP
uniref:serine protease inhibitor Kazal-type 10-like n=1 Tax=Myodes glareolus TaxID=447135 RepID=UPI002020D2A4|nr:serine protease inhibitor Kazal-type 10-like [Myodes glareolus]